MRVKLFLFGWIGRGWKKADENLKADLADVNLELYQLKVVLEEQIKKLDATQRKVYRDAEKNVPVPDVESEAVIPADPLARFQTGDSIPDELLKYL